MISNFRRHAGFTLIELLVVIAIVALMTSLVVSFVGGSFRVQIKKETTHLIGTIRYLYNEAASKSIYYRLVFDLEKQKYWIESSATPFYLVSDADLEEEAKKVRKKEDSKTETGAPLETGNEPEFARPEEEEKAFKPVLFDKEVRIRDVFVAHQEGPLSQGQAYLYFFPSGLTEQAIIHLSDENQETNYAIIVNPLTGRSRVKTEYVDYVELSK